MPLVVPSDALLQRIYSTAVHELLRDKVVILTATGDIAVANPGGKQEQHGLDRWRRCRQVAGREHRSAAPMTELERLDAVLPGQRAAERPAGTLPGPAILERRGQARELLVAAREGEALEALREAARPL